MIYKKHFLNVLVLLKVNLLGRTFRIKDEM